MSDDLHYLSATEALARFRDRSLSPVELLDAVIARAEEVEPTVNALCHELYEARASRPARPRRARPGAATASRAPLEGIPLAIKEEEAIAGQPWTQGSLIYKDLVADHSSVVRAADARRRRDRPRAHDRAGVLLRAVHPLAPARRDAQPVEPARSASAARPAARAPRWRRARRRSPAARTSAARSAPRRRSTASSASSRPTAACRRRSRSTSTPTATAARSPARSPTARCTRTCWPGRTRRTSCRCGRSSCCRSSFDGVEGLRIAVSVDLDGSWPVDPEVRAQHARLSRDALRAAGAVVDEVDLDVPHDLVMRCAAIHFRLGFGAWIGPGGRRAPATSHRVRGRVRRAEMTEEAGDGALLEKLEIEARLYAPVGALLETLRRAALPDARDARPRRRRRLRRPRPRGRRPPRRESTSTRR